MYDTGWKKITYKYITQCPPWKIKNCEQHRPWSLWSRTDSFPLCESDFAWSTVRTGCIRPKIWNIYLLLPIAIICHGKCWELRRKTNLRRRRGGGGGVFYAYVNTAHKSWWYLCTVWWIRQVSGLLYEYCDGVSGASLADSITVIFENISFMANPKSKRSGQEKKTITKGMRAC